tara:strand:- start:212 stop:502 length:291 start_codon:yes stop_codon:yes gene_type:complete
MRWASVPSERGIIMSYHKRFSVSPYHVSMNAECKKWMEENEVTIHSVRDAGMYGNRHVYYSSPTLTGGEVRNGSGYESLSGHHSTTFNHNDPVDAS